MSREEAIKELQRIQEIGSGDPEWAHSAADGIICTLLIDLGYQDVIDEWDKVEKWYA